MILLLGTIAAGPNSVALFALGDLTAARRQGEQVSFFTVTDIDRSGVTLRHGDNIYFIRPGDDIQDSDGSSKQLTITTGIEHRGSLLRVTSALREFVTKDGLLPILNQAASKPVNDIAGNQIGYKIFDIDKGSAYDLAGIENGDIITAIDGTELTNPLNAIKALHRIKDADKFSFTYARGGQDRTINVEVW